MLTEFAMHANSIRDAARKSDAEAVGGRLLFEMAATWNAAGRAINGFFRMLVLLPMFFLLQMVRVLSAADRYLVAKEIAQ